jgi:hypothetical protein
MKNCQIRDLSVNLTYTKKKFISNHKANVICSNPIISYTYCHIERLPTDYGNLEGYRNITNTPTLRLLKCEELDKVLVKSPLDINLHPTLGWKDDFPCLDYLEN